MWSLLISSMCWFQWVMLIYLSLAACWWVILTFILAMHWQAFGAYQCLDWCLINNYFGCISVACGTAMCVCCTTSLCLCVCYHHLFNLPCWGCASLAGLLTLLLSSLLLFLVLSWVPLWHVECCRETNGGLLFFFSLSFPPTFCRKKLRKGFLRITDSVRAQPWGSGLLPIGRGLRATSNKERSNLSTP